MSNKLKAWPIDWLQSITLNNLVDIAAKLRQKAVTRHPAFHGAKKRCVPAAFGATGSSGLAVSDLGMTVCWRIGGKVDTA